MNADAATDFSAALDSLRGLLLRPEIHVEEAPAPQRLAPHAIALSADVVIDDREVGAGRLVVLHDPAGPEAWEGTFRIVAFCRATLEPEMASDPLLAEVGWAWLLEALEAHGAEYHLLSGTVTRVTSESFGELHERPIEGQVELRASWTPRSANLTDHAEAWGQLLAQAAGLAPVQPGVAQLPKRRP